MTALSRRRRVASLLLTVLVAGLLLLPEACTTTPTGRRQLILVSASDMNRLGDQAFTKIKQQTPVSRDPTVNRFVQCVAGAITALTPTSYPWTVTVFKSSEVNAFALPGGRIGVYTGLLRYARTQDELAAVIGHEVGHVLSRHMDARVSAETLTGLGLAALDKAISASGSTHEKVMSALGLGAQVGVLLPFSRAQESEADLIGLTLMAEAGFDPHAAVQLWRSMATAGSAPPELLSTHPSSATRIQAMQAHMDQAVSEYRAAQRQGKHPRCGSAP